MESELHLDRLILDVTDENIHATINSISKSVYFTESDKVLTLVSKFIQQIPCRVKSLNAYARIIHYFASESQRYKYKDKFKRIFLDQIFKKPFLLDFMYHKIPLFATLRLCIDLGTFDVNDIKKYALENFNFRSQYTMLKALFFLPEINDPNCTTVIANFLRASILGTSLVGSSLIDNAIYLEAHMDKLVENNFTMLKDFIKLGSQYDECAMCIKIDDVNKLQQLSTTTNFDINEKIQNIVFEHQIFCHSNPPLISYAANYGSIKCFKFLLLNNADLNICDNDGLYPEHFAIMGGNAEIIHLIEQRRFDEKNALQLASLFSNDAVFEWLLNTHRITVTQSEPTLYSVVHTCAIANNFTALQHAIALGGNINAKGNDTLTPLMLAACFRSYETAKILITNPGIDLSLSSRHRQTALHVAAIVGDARIVKLLGEAGADVNPKDINSWTPLHHAARENNVDCVEELLNMPFIDPYMKNFLGESAMLIALQCDSADVVALFKERNLLNPNDKRHNGMSALHIACAKGLSDIVSYFLERNDADVNMINDMGHSPIFEAVMHGQRNIVMLLLQKDNIDLTIKDIFGQTISSMMRMVEDNTIRTTIEEYISAHNTKDHI